METRAAWIGAVVMTTLMVVPPGLAELPGACTTEAAFEHVPGLGPACPAEGGWRVRLPDGSTVLTHGPDPAPADQAPAHENHGMVGPHRAPRCAEEGTYRGVAIYAHARDIANDYDRWEPRIRHMIYTAGGTLRMEAETVQRTAAYRMACNAEGRVRVDNVTLPMEGRDAAFWNIVGALKDLGYDDPKEKYWVLYDGNAPCGCSGTASIHWDDRATVNNRHNRGPDWGVTYGFHPQTMMHENAHNLGAVQQSAPHHYNGWHCADGRDVMCYGASPPGGSFLPTHCPDRAWFDCRHDDYFDPGPGASGYLASHWNLGHPRVRFLTFNDLADIPSPPPLTAGPGPEDDQVELDWRVPLDEGAEPIQEYIVYRGVEHLGLGVAFTGSPYLWEVRARLPQGTTSLVDTVQMNTTYQYRVAARNAVGEGMLSDTVAWAAAGAP